MSLIDSAITEEGLRLSQKLGVQDASVQQMQGGFCWASELTHFLMTVPIMPSHVLNVYHVSDCRLRVTEFRLQNADDQPMFFLPVSGCAEASDGEGA